MPQFRTTSELTSKLRAILIRQRTVLFASGLMTTVAAGIAAWILLALTANLWVLPVWIKLILMTVAVGGAVYLFARFALGRLFGSDVDSVALALEEANPTLMGRLIAAVQFDRTKLPEGFSAELVEAAKLQALNEAGKIEFGQVVTFNPLLKTGRTLIAAASVALIIIAAAPGFFGYALEVYSNPTERVAPPIAYELIPVPGSGEHVKYRDITIGGVLMGQRMPEKARIYHRLAGGSWQKTDIDLRKITPAHIGTEDSLSFGMTFRQAERSFDYYVEAGELRTEVQKIDVVDRPRVTGINLAIFYPDYTGLSPMTIDENNGSFSAVVGSRVNLKLETNLPIERAELVFEDSSRTPLAVEGSSATTSLQVDKSLGYHIELVDHLGEKNPDPIQYYITAIPDEYPTVDVIRPGFDANLNDDMLLPLLVRIYDDFGFSSLVMKYTLVSQGRQGEENVAVLHFSDRIKTEGDIEFNWDMDPLYMFPGDFVTYYFEVADNDRISGPKIGRSRQYIARLPSLDEIVGQVEDESSRRISDVEEMLRSGKELSRRLKEAARKLEAQSPQSTTSDWQQQKELETIADQNEDMVDKIEKMANEMEKSLDKIQENSLLSREIFEKLQEIQKLFEEVATPEMREAQQRMMEMLKQMDREQLQQAMEDMEVSQEELLQRLERTLELLKSMQAQAKMEMMIRQVEELLARQDKVNEDTEGAQDQALSDLSRAEQENTEALQNLKKEVEGLRELFKQAKMDDMAEAQEFAQALEQTDADQDMQQMSESLMNQDKNQASESGKSASSKLTEMLNRMQQAQMAMTQDDSEKIKQQMRRSIEHARNLSEDQEKQLKAAAELDPTSLVLRDLAGEQQDLSQACQGLYRQVSELGQASPFIASELRALVNDAVRNMDLATAGFEDKRGIEAMRHQTDAMYDLNRATTRLMESMDQMCQSSDGASCDKPMNQLESLCNKQNQLNQKAQKMCNNPNSMSDKMGQSMNLQEMEGGMQRLAAEQGAIRKSMEQLEREFGGSRQVLGRLSDIAREMKEVEEALATGEAGPETTERQLRIYSRMLEASRSLQRKDYNEQRQATTATEQPVWVPQALPRELLDDRFELEDRLRRFLGDSYPPQYEEQIKAYFRALLNLQSGQTTVPAPQGGDN